jgi:starvation-inducible DNA-binding protein
MTAKLFPTRNDLPAEARNVVIDLLNATLADLADLSAQTKYAHWNVKGQLFIALHELFDKLYNELNAPMDDVAERITALGGVAKGTVRQAAAGSRLNEFPADVFDGRATTAVLADRYASVAKSTRLAIDRTASLGDADTADLLTGLSRQLDKALWFLEAHGQS